MPKTKAFVVSLLECTDRRKYVSKHLESLQIPFEFLDAVKGSELVLDKDKRINNKAIIESNWITPNIVGCSLSHTIIYEKVITENLDYALVLEDDIFFDKNILAIIKDIEKIMQHEQVIMLHYRCWETIDIYKEKCLALPNNYYLYDVTGKYHLLSTAGYIVTNAAAKSMLQKLLPIHSEADNWKYFSQCGAVKNLQIIYPIPSTIKAFQSTIGSINQNNKKSLLAFCVNLVERYKIPVLYQLLTKRRDRLQEEKQKINFHE
jgi:glycosyl transferase, family 25